MVAVAVLVMLSSVLGLRREAQVVIESKAYYRELAKYKQRFDGFDNTDATAVEVLSVITQFAEELDIYVVGTSLNSSAIIQIDKTNRYLLEYELPTDSEIKLALGNKMNISTQVCDLARQYGIASVQTLGSFFFGEAKWHIEMVYDGMDVSQPASTVRPSARSEITGMRITIK